MPDEKNRRSTKSASIKNRWQDNQYIRFHEKSSEPTKEEKRNIKFTEKEYEFLKNEFGFDRNKVDDFSDDEILKMGDKCFDIETEETIAAGDNELSDRGEIAAGIVTKINK